MIGQSTLEEPYVYRVRSVVKSTFIQACKFQNFCSSTCSQAPHRHGFTVLLTQHYSLATHPYPNQRHVRVCQPSLNQPPNTENFHDQLYRFRDASYSPTSRSHVQIYQLYLSSTLCIYSGTVHTRWHQANCCFMLLTLVDSIYGS